MRNYILTSVLFFALAFFNNVNSQCNGNRCAVCNVEANIISSSGIIIENGNSTVAQINQDETQTGTEMVVEAVECGELELEIEISYTWQAGNNQDAWLHGVSFGASQGWSSANGTPPGDGWAFYDEVTGFCSENTYYDGYFFDSENDDDSSWNGFLNRCTNFGGAFYQEVDNFPGDNWGVPCHDPFENSFPCPNFSFKLKYCPYEAGEANEFISFFFTNDGESGGWNDARNCNFEIVVPIRIKSAGVNVPELSLGPDCPGACYELDAGEGCEGYEWSTGDTTQIITVCPDISSEYKVSVSSSCGPDIVGTYQVDVENCCNAEVGELQFGSIDICSSDSTIIYSENYTVDSIYNQHIFIIENDLISDGFSLNDIDSLKFYFEPCGIYQLTVINYLGDSIPSLPNIGEAASEIICNASNCCDRLDTILDLRDTIPPVFFTMDQSANCDFGFPALEYQFMDTCFENTTVSIELISSQRIDSILCPIVFERIYKAKGFCGNESIDTQLIEFVPEAPQWVGFIPSDITLSCDEDLPSIDPLNYSNTMDLVMDCHISGFIIPDTLFQNDCNDGIELIWTYLDECNYRLEHKINISFEDSLPPVWESGVINDTLIIDCIDDIPNFESFNVIDNCKSIAVDDFTSNGNAGTINLCEGGSFIRTWTYSDSCDDETLVKNRMYIITPPPTVSCDDGDPCTYNDVGIFNCESNKCTCEGIPKPEIEILGSLSYCSSSFTSLSITATGNIVWNTLETTQRIEVNSEGVYSVTVTDFDGCQKESSVMVSEEAELSPLIMGDSIVCFGAATDLSVGGVYDSLRWSNGVTDSLNLDLAPGVYEVTVYNGTCIGTDVQVITERDTIAMEIVGDSNICFGLSTTLQLTEAYASYNWSNLSDDHSITVNESGIYTVTVTDTFGCSQSSSFEVMVFDSLDIEIVGDLEFCEGDSTILDAGPWSKYSWSTLDTTQRVTITQAGNYLVTVTDDNGCSANTSIEIYENPSPQAMIEGEDFFCEGDTVILNNFSSHDSYIWNTQDTSRSISVDSAGVYIVTVYDGVCEDVDSFEVFMFERFDINIDGASSFCLGDSIQVSVADVYDDYLWNNLDTSSQITIVESGDYSITVTDENGCTASSAFFVDYFDAPTVEIVGQDIICPGTEINLSVGSWEDITWSNDSISSQIFVNQGGEFQVTVTDQNGCTASTSISIIENSALEPEIFGTPQICDGDSTLLNAGSGYAIYEWNTGDNTQSIFAFETGWYAVSVSDINQVCFGQDSFYLEKLIAPNYDVIEIACSDDLASYSITLETNADRLVLADSLEFGPGIITIENIDTAQVAFFVIYGADDVCMISFEVPPPVCDCMLLADLGPDLSLDCENDSYVLSDQINDPNQNLRYLWMDEAGTTLSDQMNYEAFEAGIIILQISDQLTNCMALDTIVIDEDRIVPIAEIVADPSTIIDCFISEITLNVANLQNGIEYVWIINNLDSVYQSSISVSQESLIQLYAYNGENNCFSIDTLLIQNLTDYPLVEIQQPDTLDCNNLSVVLDGSDSQNGQSITYQWLDADFNEIVGATDQNWVTEFAGLYYLQVSDIDNGCSNLDSVMVIQDLELPVVYAGPDITWICSDSSSLLHGPFTNNPNLDGQWTYGSLSSEGISNDTTTFFEVFDEGVYYLKVTRLDNGCFAYDSIIISRSDDIPSFIEATVTEPLCEGEPNGAITIFNVSGGMSPYSYTLVSENTQEEILINANEGFTALEVGSYLLQVEDANGCQYDTLLFIDPAEALSLAADPIRIEANIGDNATVSLITNLNIDQIDTIIWSPSLEFDCLDCLTLEFENLQSNIDYEILLIDNNGCEVRTSLSIVLEQEIDIYIPNIFNPNSNLGNEIFGPKTHLEGAVIASMQIFDRWGNLIFELQDTPVGDDVGWNGMHKNQFVSNGVYVYSIGIRLENQNQLIKRAGDITVIR